MLLLEDLHDDARVAAVLEQRRARVVEVGVGVVAGAHLLDREVEDLRREPPGPLRLDAHAFGAVMRLARAPGRRRARPRRPRAARVSARPWTAGAGARGRASRARGRAGGAGA